MKHSLFKTLVVFGVSFIVWNCSDDSASSAPIDPTPTHAEAFVVNQPCWWLNANPNHYLIFPSSTGNNIYPVTDQYSVSVGAFDVNTGTIVDMNGQVVAANVDLTTLPLVNNNQTITFPDGSVTDLFLNPISPAVTTSSASIPVQLSSSSVVKPTSATSSATTTKSSASDTKKSSATEVKSSSSKAPESGKIGNITYSGSLSQTVAQNAAIGSITFSGLKSQPSRQSWNAWFINDSDCPYDANAKTFTISGKVHESFPLGEVEETWIMDGTAVTLKLNVTSGKSDDKKSSSSKAKSSSSQAKSSSSKAKSSSSQAKSSSSQAKSSSSQAKSSSSTNPGISVDIKEIPGGKSGSGFASRYWDCCKPSCSWNENSGGHPAKQCNASGNVINDAGAQSMCNGGPAGTCTSQIPIIVNDNLAYAFAAVPAADGGSCGKCFALKFDGKGKYETKQNQKALAGKTLVVMATNIGSDVQQGQFDVMIPGGGVGMFNGCSSMGWGSQGEQYGGLLSACEKEVGTAGNMLTKRKNCLEEKCNSVFSKDPKAKEGCMFLATWMEAAGNPTHTYKEVECPAELKAKY